MGSNKCSKKNSSGIIVDYQSEFMQNYIAESKISDASGIKSVRIDNDRTAIFFIDKAGILTMLFSASGIGSGWLPVALSQKGYKVSAFDFYYLENSRELGLCYAQVKDGRTEMRVAEKQEIKESDWANIADKLKFVQVAIPDSDRLIDHITCDGRGVLYSSRKTALDALYYYFRYGNAPGRYTLPENTEKVKQIEVGSAYGAFGVFILYDMAGSTRTMLFQSFPDDVYGEVTQDRMEVKANGKTVMLECFDLVKNEEGNDVIYLAGEGIYRAEAPDQPKEVIAHGNLLFSRISVAVNDDDVTVWALRPQNQSLYYTTNVFYNRNEKRETGQRWTDPLPMYRDIYDFASIKGTQLTNQLFLLSNRADNAKAGLMHVWQDAVSKSWRETEVSIENMNDMLAVSSFTIDLNLANEGSSPITDPLYIRCKENFYVYINNRKYHLSPAWPAELPYSNYYNIIYPADSIAMPEISLTAAFLDEAIHIDPTAPLKQKISEKIRNGSDLANARKQDGTPLVTGSYDQKTLDSVADAIQKASVATSQTTPVATSLGISLLSSNSVMQLPETGNAISDLLYSVRQGFDAITGFAVDVVNSAWKFVLEIGGKIIEWVVNTARDVMTFLEQVWAKIKVAFKDIVDFLAFLFDWDDILQTKEAIKLTATKILDRLDPALREGQAFVIAQIRQLKVYATQFLGLTDDLKLNQDFSSLSADTGTLERNKPDTRVNWVGSKQEIIFGAKSVEANRVDPQQLGQLPGSDEPQLKDIITILADFFNGKTTLGEFLKRMARLLVDLAFDFIEKFANELFEIVIAAINLFKEFLTGTIEIPLISGIYRNISNADLSILDFMSLLVAIPMTIAYKITHKVAPFSQFSKEEFATRISASLA